MQDRGFVFASKVRLPPGLRFKGSFSVRQFVSGTTVGVHKSCPLRGSRRSICGWKENRRQLIEEGYARGGPLLELLGEDNRVPIIPLYVGLLDHWLTQ